MMRSAKIIQSRELREQRVTIIIQTDNQGDAECIERELKRAIHKTNRHIEHKVSFDIFKSVRRT